jgi:hypothetical protein
MHDEARGPEQGRDRDHPVTPTERLGLVSLVEARVPDGSLGQPGRRDAEPVRHRDRALAGFDRGVELAVHEPPVRDDSQRDRIERVLGGAGEIEGGVGPREELVADAPPRVLAQRDDEPQGTVDVAARDCDRVRFAHVVERGVELLCPAGLVGAVEPGRGLLREVDVHVGVRPVDPRGLRPGREALAPELAQGLELPVAGTRAGVLGDQHRLVDEHAEELGHVDVVDAMTDAHAFGTLEVERAREHRDPLEQPLLRRREQVVGPLDEIAERPVPWIGRASRSCEHPKAFRKPLGELRGAHRPHARRRELECQRHAVEPDADLGHRLARRVVEHEVVLHRAGAVDEQLHRGDLGKVLERLVATARYRQRWNRPHDLGGDSKGLPARRQHLHVRAPAQDELDELTRGVEHVLAVVEHEQDLLRREELDDRVRQRPVGPLLHVERVADGRGDGGLGADRRELDETHAVAETRRDRRREPVREPGLADSTRSEEREDAPRLEEPRRDLEVALSSDEGSRVGGDHATSAPARRSVEIVARAVGERHPADLVALLEDRGLQLARRGRRLEPELVAQPAAQLRRGSQSFGLPARAREREHQLDPEALAKRMVDDEGFEAPDDLVVMTDAQRGFDVGLDRDEAQLFEADRFGLDPLGVCELRERCAAPFGECRVELLDRGERIFFEQCLSASEPQFEAPGVDQIVGDLEHVPGRPVDERGLRVTELDEPAQPRDIALQGRDRGVGRIGPQDVDQAFGRYHRVAVGEEHAQQSPGLAATESQ